MLRMAAVDSHPSPQADLSCQLSDRGRIIEQRIMLVKKIIHHFG